MHLLHQLAARLDHPESRTCTGWPAAKPSHGWRCWRSFRKDRPHTPGAWFWLIANASGKFWTPSCPLSHHHPFWRRDHGERNAVMSQSIEFLPVSLYFRCRIFIVKNQTARCARPPLQVQVLLTRSLTVRCWSIYCIQCLVLDLNKESRTDENNHHKKTPRKKSILCLSNGVTVERLNGRVCRIGVRFNTTDINSLWRLVSRGYSSMHFTFEPRYFH